jgi:hypothetical protein
MKLVTGLAMHIVWRNPATLSGTRPHIEQLVADDYSAIYAVRINCDTKAFELILHRRIEKAADFSLRICCCESWVD